jgi:hypothetical protein
MPPYLGNLLTVLLHPEQITLLHPEHLIQSHPGYLILLHPVHLQRLRQPMLLFLIYWYIFNRLGYMTFLLGDDIAFFR